jgi:hypothetical protein
MATTATPEAVRPSAVAGMFYPAEEAALRGEVDRLLIAALRARPADAPLPKALIVPHAGYAYSGAVAASAYARALPLRGRIARVVLLGPAHRVAFRGLAVPSVEAFATPFGPVPLDRQALDAVRDLPGVVTHDAAHADEHSLEVHLPFLKRILGRFALVPVLVGQAEPADVAGLLEALWGGPETLIVVSSDLSHYHDYDTARGRDGNTVSAIETLNFERIGTGDACGARPIVGLLQLAGRRDLRLTTLDVRNSGDTAGPRDRVVGYGAWSVTEPGATRIPAAGRGNLLAVAARAIRNGIRVGRRPEVRLGGFGAELEARRASFVTLKIDGRLRGCIGSVEPRRALVADVAWNAYSSGFEDPRFAPLALDDFERLELSVAVLGAPAPLDVVDEADLVDQLRPGVDGLILTAGRQRGVFLPQVWQEIPEPAEFVARLKRKAGLAPDFWSDDLQVRRFSTESFGAPVSRLKLPDPN